MNVVFYTHSKRSNSLKKPTGGISRTCVLKDDCSITSPVLELSLSEYPAYNYAYIPDFGRYYYVSDWTYYRGVWSCSLNVDVLTSWRDNILSTVAHVEYSTSDYSMDYTDNRVTPTQEKEIITSTTPVTLSAFDSTGCYILSVISTDANGYNGACAVYAMTQAQLAEFSQSITAEGFWDGIWESLKNTFNNPFEAIVSCRWIPFSISSLSGSVKNIFITYADTGVHGKLLTENFVGQSTSMFLPRADVNPSFLDVSPFTSATLYLPFIGTVALDVDAYYKSDTVSISMKCDVVTGDIVYTIGSSFTAFTSTYSGNCATQIPLSNSMVDSLGMLASTAGVIGGVVTTIRAIKNPVSAFTSALSKETAIQTGALATGASALGVAKSAEVHTSINGALSSRIGAKVSLSIQMVIMRSKVLETLLSASRIATFGLPCYKTLQLSNLNGYCQCNGASVSAPATEAEINAINTLVNSGIYIE